MYRFLFFYANMIVNKNEVLNKVKLKLKLRSQFGGVKLIFVDEISMVGNSMFAIQLNNRLNPLTPERAYTRTPKYVVHFAP